MRYYLESAEHTLAALESAQEGLPTREAEKRLREHGENKLREAKKQSLVSRFFAQLRDPMIIILLVAALVSLVTALYEGGSIADACIIAVVVLVNACLGVYQESKAEKAIEALQKMTAATSRALRDGETRVVPSAQLCVGDVILLEAGDAVPADCRLLECASMQVEEAALTGESLPVHKQIEALSLPEGAEDVPLGDRACMAYMGSDVSYGRGRAVVTAIGMDTEMGKIADAILSTAEGQTPLQKKLAKLSKTLSFVVLFICAFLFGFSLLRAGAFTGKILLETFMVAVSLAVAAIPEGLATVVTVVLSIGVTNMSKRKAVIRRLTAVETLGCTQVICSDKTGTLTQNKMTVVETAAAGDTAELARGMALCTDVKWQDGQALGEPTECALVTWAASIQLDKNVMEREAPRIGEAPFDSIRKRMSTLHRAGSAAVQYTKGAPDEVLALCTQYLENGQVKPMTDEKRAGFLAENKRMADQALRVLACAKREYAELPGDLAPAAIERELTFLGLCGMRDPVRPEVEEAVRKCREAGVRPVMITGDHIDTATAIARQLGMLEGDRLAITGAQLDKMDDETLTRDIEKYAVYARVQPEHKVRIVRAWEARGFVTAMTGDGVNDAPAIKRADIGVGMGVTGTDVTKNVADMVLADDNFATIVSAVEEGRRIYDNIRKAIQFLLSSNLAEVLAVFFATLLGFTILKPAHILFINLVTDTFPALALGMERAEKDVMRRAPRPATDGIFSRGLGVDAAYQGMLVAVLTLAAYFIGHFMESGVWEIAGSPAGMTMAFLTMSMTEVFHAFNLRSQRRSVFALGSRNGVLYGAMLFSLLLTALLVFVPGLRALFSFDVITIEEYGVAMALAVSIVPIVEGIKFVQRQFSK